MICSQLCRWDVDTAWVQDEIAVMDVHSGMGSRVNFR